jgi:hypothetical protein
LLKVMLNGGVEFDMKPALAKVILSLLKDDLGGAETA